MPTLNLNYNIIEVQRRKAVGPYPIQMEYLIVGGGGGSFGKTGNDTVAGGGAGGYITGSYCFSPNETQTFTIGAGGAVGVNGTNSTGFGLTAIGGGFGGRNINGIQTSGNSGGSGGGGAPTPGGGTAGQGFAGGSQGSNNFGGGGGGGAAEVGYSSTSNAGAAGGNGKQWLDGVYYAGGGGGSEYQNSAAPAGPNGLGSEIGGGGGTGAGGTTGIVGLRYLSIERVVVTNGTTTRVGDYTYHYFTSGTGSIQFIGDEQQDPNINPCP